MPMTIFFFDKSLLFLHYNMLYINGICWFVKTSEKNRLVFT
jgi:hypothetical protein